jgi:hypothetical protein
MALIGAVQADIINSSNPQTFRENIGFQNRYDFAWKEGPVSYATAGKLNWNLGGHQGTSLNATSNAGYITVNSSGYYVLHGWHRQGSGEYGYFSLDGNRDALESRSDNLWGHDHSGGGGNWSEGYIIGYLEAGWNISFGPPADYGDRNNQGYSGGMLIYRIR